MGAGGASGLVAIIPWFGLGALRDDVSGKLSPFMVPLGQVRLFRE